MAYLNWKEKTIVDFTDSSIETCYNEGFMFTRIGKGVMHQTRSVRIDLSNFKLSSENRRILKKVGDLQLHPEPIPYQNYSWEIAKIGKDFYEERNADFSANKIKELLTNEEKTNFNKLFVYKVGHNSIGYCIALETKQIIHYSYPFYSSESKDTGLGMILKAITLAKDLNKKYFYLGSLQRPGDTYKLQFEGIEWFDGNIWQNDVDKAKDILYKQA